MKKLFIILMFILAGSSISYSQYIQDSRIDSIVNLVSQQQITKYMRELTGDTLTTIGGLPRLIYSRFYLSPSKDLAAQYILEKFQSFGLSAYIQVTDSNCRNVIAVKQGTKYPNQKYIICGHYDNILWPVNPGPYDTVHGADDNSSGVCGVLEAARLLANMNFDYSIVFAAWDEEEIGLIGSEHYVDTAYIHGDSIKACLNMDMIAYDNSDQVIIMTNTNSLGYANLYKLFNRKINPTMYSMFEIGTSFGTDVTSFYNKGYKGISSIELNFTPYYHTINDKFSNENLPYCTKNVKTVIATLMSLALDKAVLFNHLPILSSYDTSSRTAEAIIEYNNRVPYSSNAPCLFYKSINGSYQYAYAYYRNGNTFKFSIPGYPGGTRIYYYFSIQDSSGTFSITYPPGGSGTNPPAELYSYEIFRNYSQCSNTLPKQIIDNQSVYDTISINTPGYIFNPKISLTLNHQNDGDVIIQLLKYGFGNLTLSSRNGQSGQNYINTIFDDSASVPITQGSPPFTGSFKPQSPLRTYNNSPINGNWVLRVTDLAAGNQGTIISWCVISQLRTVSVHDESTPMKYGLAQNFPNPFNSSTRINYSIPKNSNVELKIYDMLGREIRTLVSEHQTAGNYVVMFNAGELASGMYFYKLAAGDFTSIKKMVLVK
jgi:hypothetical protein